MLLKRNCRRFDQTASVVIPFVLILLFVPIPTMAATMQSAASQAKSASSAAHPTTTMKDANRFCANSDCTQTRQTFRRICDFIMEHKRTAPAIFIGGYYMRDLVAGYEIFGDQKYLDTAIAYGDSLLKKQMPNGFWATGYGPVALADTGSAVALLSVLYKHVDPARQKRYFDAVKRYTDAIQKSGMILPNGAFGDGWGNMKDGKLVHPDYAPYTLSSTLSGAIVFSWMYQVTKQDKYREIAYRALKWIFSTMDKDGRILDTMGEGGYKRSETTYGTAAYVGEGVIAFALHCDDPAMEAWIGKTVRPHIEFLLRTQLPNGTWSKLGRVSWDRTRSPGIVNYLIWYYDHVDPDPRVQKAIQRFDAFVTDPKNGKSYDLLMDGAEEGTGQPKFSSNAATGLTGRALADILDPGVDARW